MQHSLFVLRLKLPVLQFEGDVENVFCRCMQVEYECLGEMTTCDLVPDGGNVPITTANREQYVQLFVQVHYHACCVYGCYSALRFLDSGCSLTALQSNSMLLQRAFLVFVGDLLSNCSNHKN
jgi:hypothetical protein